MAASANFKKLLIHVCDIRRNSTEPPPKSGSGEPTPNWSSQPAAHEDVRLRFVEKSETIANRAEGFPVVKRHLALFPTGTDVLVTDVIDNVRLLADGSVVDAGPFRITNVYRRNAKREGHHMSATLERAE